MQLILQILVKKDTFSLRLVDKMLFQLYLDTSIEDFVKLLW